MKLVTYESGGGEPRPGVLRGEEIIDLSPVVASLLELIQGGGDALAEAGSLLDSGKAAGTLAELRLLAPLQRPNQVHCVGWNYPKHYEEGIGRRSGQETDQRAFPTFFSKPPGCVIGPGDSIAWDGALTEQLDYEGELAMVIGRGGRSIPEDSAMKHVFGFTLANDVTARDIQRRHGGQWQKGKGMDTYCPMGPVLITADECDPRNLMLRLRVNGELRQEASTGTLIYPLETLIAQLSLGMTLHPGDVLLTGTPPGVGFGLDPQVFLQPGDVTEVEIEEIGKLVNRVESAPLTAPIEAPEDATSIRR